jgi:hypothetical protein
MKNTLAYYNTKLIATVEWGPIKGSIRVGFSLKGKITLAYYDKKLITGGVKSFKVQCPD